VTMQSRAAAIAGLRDTELVELGAWLRVDGQADRPLFDQLRTQIIEAIRAGTLPPGARLPTVRELAGELGLAVNTVARAYRELESAGLVHSRVRHGTVVAPLTRARLTRPDIRRRLDAAASSYALVCQQLGVPQDEALAAVRRHLPRG